MRLCAHLFVCLCVCHQNNSFWFGWNLACGFRMKNELIKFWIWIFYHAWMGLRHDGFPWNQIRVYVLSQGINSFYWSFFSPQSFDNESLDAASLWSLSFKLTDIRWCVVRAASERRGDMAVHFSSGPTCQQVFSHLRLPYWNKTHTFSTLVVRVRTPSPSLLHTGQGCPPFFYSSSFFFKSIGLSCEQTCHHFHLVPPPWSLPSHAFARRRAEPETKERGTDFC